MLATLLGFEQVPEPVRGFENSANDICSFEAHSSIDVHLHVVGVQDDSSSCMKRAIEDSWAEKHLQISDIVSHLSSIDGEMACRLGSAHAERRAISGMYPLIHPGAKSLHGACIHIKARAPACLGVDTLLHL